MAIPSAVIDQVEILYVGYFGRAGDPDGVNAWISALNSGKATFSSIAGQFAQSQEAINKYPYLGAPQVADSATFITQVYANLLNRAPDASGLSFWKSYLDSNNGNSTAVGTFISTVIQSAQGTDNSTIQNKASVGTTFTQDIVNHNISFNAAATTESSTVLATVTSDPATVTAAGKAIDTWIATAPGPEIDLTLNVESVSSLATNAAFVAQLLLNPGNGAIQPSLQSGDSVTGPGSGSLTAFFNGQAPVPGFTMKGVPQANITNFGNNTSGFSGNITDLKTVTDLNSVGGVQVGQGGGGGLKTALSTVNIVNSSTSSFTGIIAAAAVAGAADAVTVNVTGDFGSKAVSRIISLRSDGGAADNAYENETLTATGATFAQLSDGASGVLSTKALTISGAGAVQLTANAAGDFANLKTIDATHADGGVVVTGALNVNASNGATGGNAGLLAGVTGLTSFKGGAGNDFIDVSSMTAAGIAAATLDGGAGTNTLVVNSAVAHGTTALGDTNFQVLGVGNDAGGTIDASKLGANVTTVALFGAATTGNDIVKNAKSGFTFALNGLGGNHDLTINGPSGTADVVNITDTSHNQVSIDHLVTNGFEAVNLTLSGSAPYEIQNIASNPTLGSNVIQSITDNNGAGSVFIGADNVGTGTININGTGTGFLEFFGQVTASKLDASGFSGNVLMLENSAHTIAITGSAGADQLIGSIAGKDTISAGAGDDLLINHTSTGVNVTAGTQFTTGDGHDTVLLRGDVANTASTSTTPFVTDFTLGNDHVRLDATNSATDYSGQFFGQNGNPVAGGVAAKEFNVQQNTSVGAGSGANVYKLLTGVGASDVQGMFNSAIGTATISGASGAAAHNVIVTVFDTTNSKMDILDVTTEANGSLKSGDTVHLIGSVHMTAADYAQSTGHFANFA